MFISDQLTQIKAPIRKYLVTILVEGTTDDPKHIHDSIAIQLCEEQVLDCLDYEVTHVFDVQEIPVE